MIVPNMNTLMCDCCECGIELIGRTNPPEVIAAAEAHGLPIVAGRLTDGERDAPYCEHCLSLMVPALNTEAVA